MDKNIAFIFLSLDFKQLLILEDHISIKILMNKLYTREFNFNRNGMTYLTFSLT